MSTTSSSDCDNENYYNYSSGLYENYETNIYRTQNLFPNLGNPLIYYSQINPCYEPKPRKQRSRKGNPNCFVKAFKWYTQEHVPVSADGARGPKPNMNEFASWLDTKYDEFVQSLSNEQNSYRLTLKQRSTITAEKNALNACCGVCPSNKTKSKRIKCLWEKRQRHPCSRGGAPSENTTQSFHYILQPKELSQRNSCCQSLARSTSTETQKTQRIVMKSQSCTSISREHSKADTIDIMTTQEGTKKKQYRLCTVNDMCCQCIKANIENNDVGTQYDESNVNTKNTFILKSSHSMTNKSLPLNESKIEKEVKTTYSTNNVICQCPSDEKVTTLKSTSNSKTNSKRTSKSSRKSTHSAAVSEDTVTECQCSSDGKVTTLKSSSKSKTNSISSRKSSHPPAVSGNIVCECQCPSDEKETTLRSSSKSNMNSKCPSISSRKSTHPPTACGDTISECATEPVASECLQVRMKTKTISESPPTDPLKSKVICNCYPTVSESPPADPVKSKVICNCYPTVSESPPADPVKSKVICNCFPTVSESPPAGPLKPKVICNCYPSVKTVKTGDTSTQFEHQASCSDVGKKFSSHVSQDTNTSQRKCFCAPPIRFEATVENGAQTSDHCIIFDVNASYTYPLFMKIICADKLN